MSEHVDEGKWWWDGTDVDPCPTNDGDLRRLAELHRCDDGFPPHCSYDGSRWPCETVELLCHVAGVDGAASEHTAQSFAEWWAAYRLRWGQSGILLYPDAKEAAADAYAAGVAAERAR